MPLFGLPIFLSAAAWLIGNRHFNQFRIIKGFKIGRRNLARSERPVSIFNYFKKYQSRNALSLSIVMEPNLLSSESLGSTTKDHISIIRLKFVNEVSLHK